MQIGKIRLKPKAILLVILIVIFSMGLIARCVHIQMSGSDNGNIDPAKTEQTDPGKQDPDIDKENTDNNSIDDPAGNTSDPVDGTDNQNPDDVYAVFSGALFIGDSRTEGMRLYAGIKNARFFCAKSMTIDKVVKGEKVNIDGSDMSIYDVLDTGQFTKIYICLGINELGWVSIDKFLTEYENLINEIKTRQPEAVIYIELIFPVSQAKSDKGTAVNNGQIYWYNTNLVALANKLNLIYLNPDKPLIDENGALKTDATNDGVHINSEYCKIWAEYLASISKSAN